MKLAGNTLGVEDSHHVGFPSLELHARPEMAEFAAQIASEAGGGCTGGGDASGSAAVQQPEHRDQPKGTLLLVQDKRSGDPALLQYRQGFTRYRVGRKRYGVYRHDSVSPCIVERFLHRRSGHPFKVTPYVAVGDDAQERPAFGDAHNSEAPG